MTTNDQDKLDEAFDLLDKSWGELRERSDRELARMYAQMIRSAILLLGWRFWIRHPITTIRTLLSRP